MKIGILGGAFDPPHIGHLIVSEQIKEYLKLDEMWLLPVYSHPFEKNMASSEDRLKMTQLIESEHIKASDYEYRKNKSSITIETMKLLTKERPGDTFFWCMGSDLLKDFHKWDDWKKLVMNYNIVVYPRGIGILHLEQHVRETFKFKVLPTNIYVFNYKDVVISNISSTLVRARMKEGKSIRYLIPETVQRYINEHHLYLSL